MKVRKLTLYALIISVALSQLYLSFYSDGSFSTALTGIMVVLAIWVFGLIVGVFLSLIVGKPRLEPRLYIGGQVIAYIGAIILLRNKDFSKKTSPRAPERMTENIERNHQLIYAATDTSIYHLSQDQHFLQIAFDSLESKFADPNSFQLTTYTIMWDTTNNTEKTNTVFFIYNTGKDSTLFSKIRVQGNVANIEILNGDPNKNEELRLLNQVIK